MFCKNPSAVPVRAPNRPNAHRAPVLRRFILFVLTALCLSALSFTAAAGALAGTPKVEAAMPDYDAMLATGDDLAQIVLPGDAALEAEALFDNAPPPGYCNIWSADLLDPLDLLDEIEESSALFDLPDMKLAQSIDDVAPILPGRSASQPDGLFRPPNLLA
ncbi:hypothetical protein SAMN05216321_104178 [Cupriavidus sp. OV038]|nr:hypothetical protein SAMN05216321_104178 [Cupriavidus sp. OV038]SFP30292.1 hypothetical protein SAMN05216322_105178 [Cupriavidus sp. OV096]